MKRLIKLMCAVAFGSTFGAELYVDRSGADGAYTSINAAIAAADPYDTILVRPGVYDNNPAANTESSYSDVPAVVYVTKPLTIRATSDNPADTHIVGSPDPDVVAGGDAYGGGPNAVRCVRFSLAASQGTSPSVLKGFTIRDGRCYTKETEPDDDCGEPGGVAGSMAGSANFYVVDCVISNCVGVRGGLVRKGTYVRCRFSDGYGYAGQSVGRNISMLSCLVVHCGGNTIVMDGGAIVNTTFADMGGVPYYTQSSVPLYNCVIASCKEDRAATAKGSATDSLIPYPEAVAAKVRCVDQISDSLPYPLIAPLAGDFRLRSGTAACGIGRAEHIATCFPDAPAIVDVYKDFGGRRIPQVGAINPGCYQEAVESATGVMQFGTPASPCYVCCDGWIGQFGCLYAYGTEPHEMFRVSAIEGSTPAFMFKIGQFYRYPDMDESILCMCPPVGAVATNSMTAATAEYWVDPVNGVDGALADGYGTQSKPFKTLQRPCNLAYGGQYTLVHAAEGTYDEGGKVYDSSASGCHTNRVCIMEARNVRIKGAGRGRSFIVGKSDTASEGTRNGMGPAAVRCVLIDYDTYGCVQGFTLQDGYSDYSSGNDDNRRYSGGLYWAGRVDNRQHVLSDCELVGGKAFRGGVCYGGSLVRCIVRGHETPSWVYGGALRSCTVENCLFYGNNWGSSNAPDAGNVSFFGCTMTSDQGSPVRHGSAALKMVNCLVLAGGESSASSTANLANVTNSILWGYESVSGSDTLLLADQKFVDHSARDYRLRTDSPALTAGFPALVDEWQMVHTDVNGDACRHIDGSLVPGAVHDAVEVVTVLAPQAGSFDVSGDTVLEDGDTLTVHHDSTGANHRLLGLSVNGELQEGASSYSYTASSAFAADGSVKSPVVVSAQYSTNWYVNANTGSDGNDGFTPETPWRTLAKLQTMTNVFWTGDVVHAAAGDYNEGSVLTTVKQSFNNNYAQLPSRVEVPAGVALVADEGPEVTFITGASGSGSYGMGSTAVRCVVIANRARIEGFTLRGGRTFEDENDGDQFCGGGVFGMSNGENSNASGVAYGCVITNCVAQRGGAVRGTRAVNCKILNCGAKTCSAAGSMSWFLGCYINGCRYTSSLMRESYFVGNCTFGPTQYGDGSSAVKEVDTRFGGVVNCVFLNKLTVLRKNTANHYRGCKFLKMDITDPDQLASLGEGCQQFESAEEFGLDPDTGAPLSKTAGTVDSSADALSSSATNYFGGVDVYGGQRIYNGKMDAGCYEYDWRSEYSKVLGASVSVAGPQVVEAAGGVLVRSGKCVYDFPTNGTGRNAKCAVPFVVTGSGELSVFRNDESLGAYSYGDGEKTLAFRSADMHNRMSFTYAPGAVDEGGALLKPASYRLPGFVMGFH